MLLRNIVITTGAALIAACAAQPVYTPADGPRDTGYSDAALGGDRHRVSFNGPASVEKSEVKDYALLRAAELTLEKGHEWFYVAERETESRERKSPGASFGAGQDRVVRECGLLGCSETRVIGAGMTADSGRTRTTYSHSLEIVTGKGEKPGTGVEVYDASELAATIRGRM